MHHNGWELVRLGERNGPATPRIERIADDVADAGFRVQVYDDVERLVWEKLICNVCFSATCAILERTIRGVLDDAAAWHVASSCALEAYDVARARGIALDFDDPVAYVRAFGEKIPDARPSMLLDLLAGRPCEIDVINGAIPPAAREVGLAAPVNETITALVRAKSGALVSGAPVALGADRRLDRARSPSRPPPTRGRPHGRSRSSATTRSGTRRGSGRASRSRTGRCCSAATERIRVASGIANIWARDAVAAANAARVLADAFDDRFLLGLGVSHPRQVDPRGHRYERPVARMSAYLDAMDDDPFVSPDGAGASRGRRCRACSPRCARRCSGSPPRRRSARTRTSCRSSTRGAPARSSGPTRC